MLIRCAGRPSSCVDQLSSSEWVVSCGRPPICRMTTTQRAGHTMLAFDMMRGVDVGEDHPGARGTTP